MRCGDCFCAFRGSGSLLSFVNLSSVVRISVVVVGQHRPTSHYVVKLISQNRFWLSTWDNVIWEVTYVHRS